MKDFYLSSYKNLIVWQKAMDLVKAVYVLTAKFPDLEKFVLVSQMRRCAISIPSNIAEGKRRGHLKVYKNFLLIAFGSGAELETQIEIAKNLHWSKALDFSKVDSLLEEVMRMLNVLIYKN